MTKPLLLVVTGRPASGKTTLAHALAREIRCPAFSRDEFKEGFVNSLGDGSEVSTDTNWYIYGVFFDAVELLLAKDVTVVAEAAFQHKLWAPKLEPLKRLARIRVVVCTVDPAVARARFIARGLADPERGRFHRDGAVKAAKEGIALPIGPYEPPSVDVPTLTVDTTDGYNPAFQEIVNFASSGDEERGHE